ncbi:MAG: hypothetical protein COA61_001585 [Zetaproteobacteria bacterium]|nr:hypothetical protein [Zetaproteobacteria bacterium]
MAKSWREVKCELNSDKSGVIWDLILYVPTVGFLLLIGLRYWYTDESSMLGEGLMFLGFFFFIVAANRISRRLLLMPSSPVGLDIRKEHIAMILKNGEKRLLMRDIRFFSDKAGKSFGLTGMDERGSKQQYVFHKGQFSTDDFDKIGKALAFYK